MPFTITQKVLSQQLVIKLKEVKHDADIPRRHVQTPRSRSMMPRRKRLLNARPAARSATGPRTNARHIPRPLSLAVAQRVRGARVMNDRVIDLPFDEEHQLIRRLFVFSLIAWFQPWSSRRSEARDSQAETVFADFGDRRQGGLRKIQKPHTFRHNRDRGTP